MANGTIIVLSDMRSVKDILDDRSGETAFRPSLYAADVVTEKKYIPLANPGASNVDVILVNSGLKFPVKIIMSGEWVVVLFSP